MITAFTRRSVALLERSLGEGDDEHLARRVAEDVIDRRREEPRLPPPSRRRAEHDQVGAVVARLVDDRVADRAGDDRVCDDLDAVLLAERPGLGERRFGPNRGRPPAARPRAGRRGERGRRTPPRRSRPAPSRARSRSRPSPRRCRRASSARAPCDTTAPGGSVATGSMSSSTPASRRRRTTKKTTSPISKPGRAGVAGARMGDQREDPDAERERRADQSRQRQEHPADPHLGLGPERALEIRLLATEPDHRELGRGEREQHAERVRAREERRIVSARRSPSRPRSRSRSDPVARSASRETSERRSRRPNSRGSMPCSPIERPSRVHPVIAVVAAANRISAPERPTTTRSDVDERRREVAFERGHDPDDRRLQPIVGEVGRAVLGRERRHARRPRSAPSR